MLNCIRITQDAMEFVLIKMICIFSLDKYMYLKHSVYLYLFVTMYEVVFQLWNVHKHSGTSGGGWIEVYQNNFSCFLEIPISTTSPKETRKP